MQVLYWGLGERVCSLRSFPVQNPTRPSSTLRCRFAVEACSEFRRPNPHLLHWACSNIGAGLPERRYLKHVRIFLKTDSLEDSLCAPGSPLLRSKDDAWI